MDVHRWRVLLADDNPGFLDLLALRINAEADFEVVYAAIDGEDALRGISECQPDIVVLDIFMPKLDGIAVQERLRGMPDKPKIVIFSAIGPDHILKQALALGADAYFIKPFDLDVFIRRLRFLMGDAGERQPINTGMLTGEDLDARVTEMLRRLAVAPRLAGYRYLKKAIIDVVNDKGMLESITHKIYPSIAKLYKTTPSCIERAMRCSIANAWSQCPMETIKQIFGAAYDENKGCPSNREFIVTITDRILYDGNHNQ
jgi:two-component system response regulator (stage 0 sporulation protein A)